MNASPVPSGLALPHAEIMTEIIHTLKIIDMELPPLYELTRDFDEKYRNKPGPSLEEYLRSLWSIVSRSQDLPISQENVAFWLDRAFTEEPPPFDPAWMLLPKIECDASDTFEGWESIILYQIADLRRMADAGMLDNPYRYMGLTSPMGLTWYNFDPLSYLECGMSGLWDNTFLRSAEPVEVNSLFSWREFSKLLFLGRIYE